MINDDSIKENLELFSFPRLSGTRFERKAFDLLKNKLGKRDINPKIEEFTFSTFYARVYPKLLFSSAFWLLLVVYLNNWGFFTQINLLIFFIESEVYLWEIFR